MKMTRRALIKARFLKTREGLDEILARLTPELMEWAPADGMRTVAGQLAEIASVEVPLVPLLKHGRHLSESEVDAAMGDPHSFENLKRVLIDIRHQTHDYLDSLSEAELSHEVSCGRAWFGTLWMATLPRAEVFLNVTEHELYHVGQLTSYLWYRGDNPYNW